MYKMPNGPTAYFDVDDTLIMWTRPNHDTPKHDIVEVTTRGVKDSFVVNHHNVEYLKKLSIRGHAIFVWSAGGSCWAEAVIKALKLEKYVWAVGSKPTYFVDDIKDPRQFVGKHVYYDVNGVRTGFVPNNLEDDT